MFLRSTVLISLLAGLVAGQTTANSTIDPSAVPATLRSQWCQGQTNTCGTLCSGDLKDNECNPDTLMYTCTCAANSSSPGLQYYRETMPTFICEKIFDNCIKDGENSQAAQSLCTANEKKNCGQLDPQTFVQAAPSSTPESSASKTGSSTSETSPPASAASVNEVSAKLLGITGLSIGCAVILALLP
ncbi:hypothetical protein K3495_g4169 [Podosphaera aphanis]|nr:hypothetical protein K3495_g4169 [Podosphaera aphanis]